MKRLLPGGLVIVVLLLMFAVVGVGSASAAEPGLDPVPTGDEVALTAATSGPDHFTTGAELLYVPINSCRIVDTRQLGGRFGPGESRSYFVSSPTGYAGQGGTASSCGIPTTAYAIQASFNATNGTGNGVVKAFETNSNTQNWFVLHYGTATANEVASIQVGTGSFKGLTLQNQNASADLLVDVVGYYVPQMQARTAPDGHLLSGGLRLTFLARQAAGFYDYLADRDVTNCSVQISGLLPLGYATYTTDHAQIVVDTYLVGPNGNLTHKDMGFSMLVTC